MGFFTRDNSKILQAIIDRLDNVQRRTEELERSDRVRMAHDLKQWVAKDGDRSIDMASLCITTGEQPHLKGTITLKLHRADGSCGYLKITGTEAGEPVLSVKP
jgi:hypothetical protein